jgi:hypothetical protein
LIVFQLLFLFIRTFALVSDENIKSNVIPVNEALALREDLERIHLAEGHSNRTNQTFRALALTEGGRLPGINLSLKPFFSVFFFCRFQAIPYCR